MYSYIKKQTANMENTTVIAFMGLHISRDDLWHDTDAFATFLRYELGLKRGDSIAIYLPNIPQAVVAIYAANKCGGISNIIHPLTPTDSLIDLIKKGNSKYLLTLNTTSKECLTALVDNGITPIICDIGDAIPKWKRPFYRLATRKKCVDVPSNSIIFSNCLSVVKEFEAEDYDNEPAVYLHSGGTAGVTKSVSIPNISLDTLADSLRDVIPDLIADYANSNMLMVLPLFHGFGLGVCLHTIYSFGFKLVMAPFFEADTIAKLIKREGVVSISGVPSMYAKLLKSPYFNGKHLSKLQYLFCGGDKLPTRLKHDFDERMRSNSSPARLQEGYGLTEMLAVCAVSKREETAIGTVGKPLRGLSVKIVDEKDNILPAMERGEICVAGATKMLGYLENGSNTALRKDDSGIEWVYTGDCGYVDDEGKLYFTERLKRMLKISGINVFPAEIESLTNELPFVERSCAVDKTVDGKTRIRLYIQTSDGVLTNEQREIVMSTLKHKLMKYSLPSEITATSDMPLTPYGKVDYRALRERD